MGYTEQTVEPVDMPFVDCDRVLSNRPSPASNGPVFRIITLAITAFFLQALSGCGPWALTGRSTHGTMDAFDSGLAADSALACDSIPTMDSDDNVEPAQEMLMDARQALDTGDFALAHRLMLSAVYELDTLYSDSTDPRRSQLIEQLVAIYADSLPAAYSDSVPPELSMLVLERQLAHAFDSLQVSPDDSLSKTLITCQKQTAYNVPVVYNDRVLGALEFFVNRRRETMQRWFERMPYYLPLMQQMFSERDIPTDLAYLPLIESGFNPKAYSFAHASGIWQFIYATGSRYGLRRNFWIDERRDPLKSTAAAIGYLDDLYDEFGDWYLVLAAYNCGEGGVRRAVSRAETADYWSLTLPRETMLYVPKFLSSLMVAKNPGCFGYEPLPGDSITLAHLDTVYVHDCIDMATLEKGMGLKKGTLRALNPHILQWCTPPDMKNVLLYLPPGARATCDSVITALPENEKVRWYRYRIRGGDNLIAIAAKFGLSVKALKNVNKLNSNRIIAGRYLFIPLPSGRSAKIGDENTAGPDSPSAPRPSPKKDVSPVPSGHHSITYRVKPGETLSQIAEVFHVPLSTLSVWNRISNRDNLRAGSRLVIYVKDKPGSGAPANTGTSTTRQSGPDNNYVVKAGENLSVIARKLNVSVQDLCRWNARDRSNPIIHPGEKLKYQSRGSLSQQEANPEHTPAGTAVKYKVSAGDNLIGIAGMFHVPLEQVLKLNGLTKTSLIKIGQILKIPPSTTTKPRQAPTKGEKVIYYKVQPGDNLWNISREFSVPLSEILSLNNLDRGAPIKPGDTLKIILTERE